MTKLNAASRGKLKTSQFALPGRKYPVHDASHASNAKARATQQFKAGRLSSGQRQMVNRKADSALRRMGSGGR